jgi:hypothetical protein
VLLGHDVVADREAESGSLAGWPGGKERLKELVLDLGRNAGAVVVDTEFNGEAEFLVGFFEGSAEFHLYIIGVEHRASARCPTYSAHVGRSARSASGRSRICWKLRFQAAMCEVAHTSPENWQGIGDASPGYGAGTSMLWEASCREPERSEVYRASNRNSTRFGRAGCLRYRWRPAVSLSRALGRRAHTPTRRGELHGRIRLNPLRRN